MLVTLDLKTLGNCDVCANVPNSGHLANVQISTKLKSRVILSFLLVVMSGKSGCISSDGVM